jgi:hypothetical protein
MGIETANGSLDHTTSPTGRDARLGLANDWRLGSIRPITLKFNPTRIRWLHSSTSSHWYTDFL